MAHAQFSDDFSDGDFTSNPAWSGNTEDFIVNSNQELQLMTSGSGNSVLYLPFSLPDSSIWEFYTKLDFAPSSSNQLRVYLLISDTILNQGNGYYLQVGETGNEDAVHLYRADGASSTLLASGTLAAMGGEPAIARIQVMRRSGGEWTLAADYNGGNSLVEEFRVIDNTYAPSDAFFALSCTYSASRSDKFFFDDISLQPIVPDILPPVLNELIAINSQTLQLTYAEALDSSFVVNPNLYEVDGGIGLPAAVVYSSTQNNQLQLEFSNAFVSSQNYQLSISAVSDLYGNTSAAIQRSFSWVEIEAPDRFDILINEIMADPTRSGGATIGLPDQEFIELYNRSDKIIDLADMILEDPGASIQLPRHLLYPGDYLIVYQAGLNSFAAYGDTLALSGFLSLSNSGDQVSLKTSDGTIIHQVDYDDDWYRDNNKAEGGWTLELVSPENICQPGALNWLASTNINGGTPGQPNSVLETAKDLTGPTLLRVFPASANQLAVFFDESVDQTSGLNLLYTINGVAITSAIPQAPHYTSVLLTVDPPLAPKQLYTLQVSQDLEDCLGNSGEQDQVVLFGLPDQAEVGDIVLNELLYYPESGGSRFVELFNSSEKTINIGELIMAKRTDDGFIEDAEPITGDFLLLPDSFCVISPNPLDILSRYRVKNPAALIGSGLPSYDNREDRVVLYRPDPISEVILDELAYNREFPYALLDNQRGVSLERINPFTPTQTIDNWHSAAENVGYATPTYVNSQNNVQVNSTPELFSLSEKKVSPDNDGFQDILLISYATEQPGFNVNIDIYDSQGRLIRKLGRSMLLGTQGNIKWDGLNESGKRLPLGVYIIQLDAFAPDGRTSKQRLNCIVAYPLE